MLNIQENFSLKCLNSFKIDAKARYYICIDSVEELQRLVRDPIFKNNKIYVLGEGSNTLFTKDFGGLVVKVCIKGKELVQKSDPLVFYKFNAGENWDEIIEFLTNEGISGLQLLSGIPGSVGAAPVQNIGAYGDELSYHFESLEAVDVESGDIKEFRLGDCEFGYRESVFKTKLKDKFIITSVTFVLKDHVGSYKLDDLKYKGLKEELDKRGIKNPTPKDVRDVVLVVRASKLPDIKKIGTAGSFFKNPYVEENKLNELMKKYPDMPYFEEKAYDKEKDLAYTKYKLSAGWLIEQVGYKGKRIDDYGVYDKHALVLVNYGNATGEEIYNLAQEIKKSVRDKFGIILSEEVNLI